MVGSVTETEIVALYVIVRSIFNDMCTIFAQLLELYTQRVKKCYENLICSTVVRINEILIVFELFQNLHKFSILTLHCRPYDQV